LADSRSLPATVLAGVWRVVAGSTVDRPVVGRFVVGEATFHGAGTSHGGTAFRGEAGFHGAPAGRCQITSWSGKGAGGSLSHDRYLLSRPSLSPDPHPARRLAVPPVHLELPEMWRSFSDGAKERQETGAGLRHRYLVSEIPRCRRLSPRRRHRARTAEFAPKLPLRRARVRRRAASWCKISRSTSAGRAATPARATLPRPSGGAHPRPGGRRRFRDRRWLAA